MEHQQQQQYNYLSSSSLSAAASRTRSASSSSSNLDYDAHHADVSNIPIEAVVGPSAGGSSFGEDYQVHRSVATDSYGGMQSLLSIPPPSFAAHPHQGFGDGVGGLPHAGYLGGARYSPTGLPLADVTPLKYSKQQPPSHSHESAFSSSLPKSISSGSKSTSDSHLCLLVQGSLTFSRPDDTHTQATIASSVFQTSLPCRVFWSPTATFTCTGTAMSIRSRTYWRQCLPSARWTSLLSP